MHTVVTEMRKTNHEWYTLSTIANQLGWGKEWYDEFPIVTTPNGGVLRADGLSARYRTLVEVKPSDVNPLVGTKQAQRYIWNLSLYRKISDDWRGLVTNGRTHWVQEYEDGVPTSNWVQMTLEQIRATQQSRYYGYNKFDWMSLSAKNTWSREWGPMRQCNVCRKTRAAVQFSRKWGTPSNRRAECRECDNRQRQLRRLNTDGAADQERT